MAAEDIKKPDERISTAAARQYWESVEADNVGMLGGIPLQPGFSQISRTDLRGSRTFLSRLGIGNSKTGEKLATAVDCGAGIGRITEGLLLSLVDQVDIVEPCAKFTENIRSHEGVRKIYNVGLEEWQPDTGARYDLIWAQWCLCQITDDQIVQYLKICKNVLKEEGVMVIKENLSEGEEDEFHEVDHTVMRKDDSFRKLFDKAGFQLVRTALQRGMPETPNMRLLPLRMYAIKPK